MRWPLELWPDSRVWAIDSKGDDDAWCRDFRTVHDVERPVAATRGIGDEDLLAQLRARDHAPGQAAAVEERSTLYPAERAALGALRTGLEPGALPPGAVLWSAAQAAIEAARARREAEEALTIREIASRAQRSAPLPGREGLDTAARDHARWVDAPKLLAH